MRLLFVADLHYSLKQFDWLLSQAGEYDLVAIGGDLLDLASPLEADVQIAIVEKYLTLLSAKCAVVVSSGNHDGDNRNQADESIADWVRAARGDRLHVDGDSFELKGATITVCPWWDGEVSRGEVEVQLERAAARAVRPWLWIYHAPPEGARTSWTGRKYVGDEALRRWIERFAPDMVLSGHIHNSPFYDQGSWIDRIGKTWVFNPGRQPGPEPTCLILDLQAMTAEWWSAAERSFRDLRIAEG